VLVDRMEALTRRNYVLVIAHPDDESMFFLPMIYNIMHDANYKCNKSSLHILCLSNGNYDKLGAIRERELHAAVALISHQIKVTIVRNSKLLDGPKESWSCHLIGTILVGYIQKEKIDKQPVTTLVTFDKGGVSGHANHVDTHEGVLDFYLKNHLDLDLELWTLVSIENIVKKYVPILPVLRLVFMWIFSFGQRRHIKMEGMNQCSFMMMDPMLVWRAMNAHYTQFVWYRRLFVVFSRYSYVNDFTVHKRQVHVQVPVAGEDNKKLK